MKMEDREKGRMKEFVMISWNSFQQDLKKKFAWRMSSGKLNQIQNQSYVHVASQAA